MPFKITTTTTTGPADDRRVRRRADHARTVDDAVGGVRERLEAAKRGAVTVQVKAVSEADFVRATRSD
jgi:hypothetical protein